MGDRSQESALPPAGRIEQDVTRFRERAPAAQAQAWRPVPLRSHRLGDMTRRQMIGAAMAFTMRQRADAQSETAIRYREYARCLPDYLAGLAADAYGRRNARVAKLTTATAIREYQAWARRTL